MATRAPMTGAEPPGDRRPASSYAAVLAFEIIVLSALWAAGVYFGSL